MERAERIILLSLGLLFEALLVPVLVIMLALTLFTAAQRFVKVWRAAGQGRPVPARPSRRNPRRRTRTSRPSVAERRENWRRRNDRRR